MRKAFWFSDIHLRPAHTDHASKLMDRLLSLIEAHKPDVIVNTGDTFHTKNTVYASMHALYDSFLDKATALAPVYTVVGNHDWADEYRVHSLQLFKSKPKCHIVDEATMLTDKVAIMSYCRHENRFEDLLKKITSAEMVFGHFDMNGFNLGSGWEETSSWSEPSKFKQFKRVFSGHYHLNQTKTVGQTEITFVGSPYTTEFGESDQEKFVMMIDLETGLAERISTGLIFHKTIKVSAHEPLPQIDLEQIANGCEFRVVITGTKEAISEVHVPKDFPAKIVYDVIDPQEDRLNISPDDRIDATIQKYVEYELIKKFGSLDKSPLSVDKLVRLGLRAISEGQG